MPNFTFKALLVEPYSYIYIKTYEKISLQEIPKFLKIFWCESFRRILGESPQNFAETVRFHKISTRKLGEISVFYSVHLL